MSTQEMSTASGRRLYEIERQELVEVITPRALYQCLCGAQFFGGLAAEAWFVHTVPCCQILAARIRLQRELEATRLEKNRVEYAMVATFLPALEKLGWTRVCESLASTLESLAERDNPNAECWKERARALFDAAEVGEER